MSAPEVSHGRGGAGNINPDGMQYVDGEVVRTGVVGSHGDGAFSTGRGGAANIGDVGTASTARRDVEVVPEAATRFSADAEGRHVGRGGAGNELPAGGGKVPGAKSGEGDKPVGWIDRLRERIGGLFRK